MEIGIVTSINTITKKEYPEIWSYLIDDPDLHDMKHRRGPTFYVTPHYIISAFEDKIPEELFGHWEADTGTWSDDWGLDYEPDTLYRVESKEEIVTTTKQIWRRVA